MESDNDNKLYPLGSNTIIIDLKYENAYGQKIYALKVDINKFSIVIYQGPYGDCMEVYQRIIEGALCT